MTQARLPYLEDLHEHHLVASRVGPHEAGVRDGVRHVLDGLRRCLVVGVCNTQTFTFSRLADALIQSDLQ